MTVLVATKNAHKVAEMAALLADIPNLTLVPMSEAGFSVDIEENGSTFEENARIKARELCRLSNMPTLADDSGLCVDALGGMPGVRSARYASETEENASDEANIEKLLYELRDIPSGERTARFVSALALVLPDRREFCVKGLCEGHITREVRGNGGFGYDPVFYCPTFGKTFGELTADEKNSLSHRNRSVLALKPILKELFG